MEILLEYGLGKNLQRLLERYWEGWTLVARSGGDYDLQFKTDRGVN